MKSVIKSLSTSGGYLEDSPLELSRGLNCIIGSRGTCKSTIVETIRFLFDYDKERVSALLSPVESSVIQSGPPSSRGLIRASLSDGTARCVVESQSGGDLEEEFLIERSVDSKSRVYKDGVQEVGAPEVLNNIEIYSQGQLERIAEDPTLRLQLIDRPNQERVDRLKQGRAVTIETLRDLGPKIRRLRNEIDTQKAEIRSLDVYRRDLEVLRQTRPELSPGLSVEREAFQKRKEMLESLQALGKERVEVLSSILAATRNYSKFKGGAGLLSALEYKEAILIREHFDALAAYLERTRAEAEGLAEESLGHSLEVLGNIFDGLNDRYLALRREEQEASESLRKEDALRQQIGKMAEIERRVLALSDELVHLLEERTKLRAQLSYIGDQLYQLRIEEVGKINSEFGAVILLSLHQGTESSEYRALVNGLLQGSRIRNQEDVASDISRSVLPSDLIDIIETGDAKRLSDFLNRDIGQMTRLVSYLLDSQRLYDLEGLVFEDWLEITMYISSEPKPISQLSKGQMATALLPLILRSASYPLIFDQPEDDLDNAFVFQTLIARIRELKLRRQLIFVTHNANIPVLGEADRVFVMSMVNPRKAESPFVGDVDESREHILALLEGGAQAFKRRQERYRELIA